MIPSRRILSIGPIVVAAWALACSPPPSAVAVDAWLRAFAAGDEAGLVEHSYSGDRELIGQAMAELKTVPTGTLAMALPPRPLSHELIEIESKDDENGRHVVVAKVTMKNPLPFSSKRVGQKLEGIPEIREKTRRFLSVREGERWGVKLDLPAVLSRARFVAEFQRALSRGELERAEAMLKDVPAPPDEANALKKSDRLMDTLRAELTKAREKKSPPAMPVEGQGGK